MDPVTALIGWPVSLAVVGVACWCWGHYRGRSLQKIESLAQAAHDKADQAVEHAKAATAGAAQAAADAVKGALSQPPSPAARGLTPAQPPTA